MRVPFPLACLTLSLLAACSPAPTTPDDAPLGSAALGQPATLEGKLEAWGGGDAQVRLMAYRADGDGRFTVRGEVASAAVSSEGRFTLSLPASAGVAPYLRPLPAPENLSGCTATQQVQPASLKLVVPQQDGFVGFNLRKGSAEDQVLLSKNLTALGGVFATVYYADGAGTVTAQESCLASSKTTVRDVQLNLQAGWNVVIQTVAVTSSETRFTYRSAPPTRSMKWYLRGGLASTSLNALERKLGF